MENIKFVKIEVSTYTILLNDTEVGTVEKRGGTWVVLGTNGLESGVFSNTRKDAVEQYIEIIGDNEVGKYRFENVDNLKLKERRLVFLCFRTKKWRVSKKISKKLEELYKIYK